MDMNNQNSTGPLAQVVALLMATNSAVTAILRGSDYEMIGLRITSTLTKETARLQQLTGTFMQTANSTQIDALVAELKPLESIGGEPLGRPKPLLPEDLNVDGADQAAFLAKRDALADRFLEMTDEQLFLILRQPEGETMIRSVAKKSGMPDYRAGEVNTLYVERVRENLRFQIELTSTTLAATEAGVSQNPGAGAGPDADDDDEDGSSSSGPQWGAILANQQQPQEQPIGTDSAGQPLPGQDTRTADLPAPPPEASQEPAGQDKKDGEPNQQQPGTDSAGQPLAGQAGTTADKSGPAPDKTAAGKKSGTTKKPD